MPRDFDPTPSTPEFNLENAERETLEALATRFEKLNIHTKYGIYSGNTLIAGKDVDEFTFAASTGKLPLADMAIHRLSKNNLAPALLTAMLQDSSNQAYRELGVMLGGPATINKYYEEHEWAHGLVGAHPENGRALIGNTTVNEAHKQLHSLLHHTTGDPHLRETAQDALRDNTVTKHGIRQLVTPDENLMIYNKTGESGPYRNDVGQLIGLKGEVGYVILTEGPSRLANMAVAEFTATIAEFAGAPQVPRSIGNRAIFGSLWFGKNKNL